MKLTTLLKKHFDIEEITDVDSTVNREVYTIWVGVGLYSIWLGFSKLFKDNSISIGGIEAVSLLDTTPFAIMFIFCGVLIITFIWVGYISKRLKNEA